MSPIEWFWTKCVTVESRYGQNFQNFCFSVLTFLRHHNVRTIVGTLIFIRTSNTSQKRWEFQQKFSIFIKNFWSKNFLGSDFENRKSHEIHYLSDKLLKWKMFVAIILILQFFNSTMVSSSTLVSIFNFALPHSNLPSRLKSNQKAPAELPS